MNSRGDRERVFGLVAISAAAHLFAFAGLGLVPPADEIIRNRAVEFQVVEPEKPAEPTDEKQAPEPPPESEPAPKPEPKTKPKRPAEPPGADSDPQDETPDEQQPPAEVMPVEFPGVTLTTDNPSARWATVVGSGKKITKPVVVPRPSNKRQGQGSGGASPAARSGPARAARKRPLSRPPQQPASMDEILLQNYPKQARAQGIEGYALLKLRILANGQVADVRIVRETYAGFGEACEKTVKSGRWRPRLDESGQPTPVNITYTCRFEVGY